jgi:hypothetical protein
MMTTIAWLLKYVNTYDDCDGATNTLPPSMVGAFLG